MRNPDLCPRDDLRQAALGTFSGELDEAQLAGALLVLRLDTPAGSLFHAKREAAGPLARSYARAGPGRDCEVCRENQSRSPSARGVGLPRPSPSGVWRRRRHVAAAFWSASESFNTTAETALYAGPVSPEVEGDFDVSGVLNQVAGWKLYEHTRDVTSGADGQLHIGVGVNVVWETWITYYLDDVRVWVEPR